jgi:5-methylcytosine-specific restriction protein A
MFNPKELAIKAKILFGIEFSGEICEIDGGKYAAIRPTDLESGNGFFISFSRTTKFMEASLRLDTFGGSILRKMSEADEDQKSQFQDVHNAAVADGLIVDFSINSTKYESIFSISESRWTSLDLNVLIKLNSISEQEALDRILITCIGLVLSLLPVETMDYPGMESYSEGAIVESITKKYERNPINRANCIKYFGALCQICHFDFEQFYGDPGRGFIEVHHTTPISKIGTDYKINPTLDLITLCSNCHSVIHRRNPPYTIDELKKIIEDKNSLKKMSS